MVWEKYERLTHSPVNASIYKCRLSVIESSPNNR